MSILDSFVQETVGILENEFYTKPFSFSYSSVRKLLWNPNVFYDIYILGLRPDKKESHLVDGKLIHALLLNTPEEFSNMYCISAIDLPSDNIRKIVDKVWNRVKNSCTSCLLQHNTYEILEEMRKANFHQSLNTDSQRLDKVISPITENYWDYLIKKKGKELIDEKTYERCLLSSQIIADTPALSHLLGMYNQEPDVEVFNERTLELTPGTLKNFPFGLKGILDNYKIDHGEKTIYINDLKTTSKTLKDFPESVEFWDYWLQAAIYMMIIGMNYMGLILRGYKVRFHFIVLDNSLQAYAFPVSEQTMVSWTDRMLEVLSKAEYHYSNKKYDLPYDFSLGNVVL